MGQILKYAKQYQGNHIYQVRYKKSKDPDAYLRRHETELLLHDGAENMLKRLGINPKTVDIEKIRSEYNALSTKKKSLKKNYQSAKNDCDSLQKNLDNLQQYLDQPTDEKRTNKSIIQNRNTL